MKTENNKIHCWAEDKLFLIWIIINKTKPEDRHFFSYFIDNKDEHKFGREVKGFIEALGLFNVKMNNPKFDYEFYQMEDKKMGNQYEKGLLEECKDKDFEDNIKNILKNRFSAEDLIIYLTETDDISLLYYIDFEIKLDEKEKNKLNKELDEYLDTFIESRLYSEKQNIFTFDIHKKTGFEAIYEIYDKYGDHFIIDQEYKDAFQKREFLFIHFFLALDRLGYADIQNIEFTNVGISSFLKIKYKIRILLLESFFENTWLIQQEIIN